MDSYDNALARAFQEIDDPQARSKSLTNFIETLSPWERRHIRLQLGDRDGLAGFEDLPPDIVCLLVRYLLLEDVLACSAVSMRCRTTWTEPSVAAALFLRFFPALQPPFTFTAFHKASRKYFRRRAGKFTSKLEMSLPRAIDAVDSDESSSMHSWDRDSRKTFRLDPDLHPDGKYPNGWLETFHFVFACYGGGNVVCFALRDFFVVDNLYRRTRKVVRVSGGLAVGWKTAASKSLVVLNDIFRNKLLVYNLETNALSHYQLPSDVMSMVVRDRRIFLVLSGLQICVLDHDGSRILTKFHFGADKGVESERPGFHKNHWWPTLVYPHPHHPDRFFVAIMGWLDVTSRPEEADSPPMPDGVRHLVVREFDGVSHVATYHDSWRLYSSKLTLREPSPGPQSAGSKITLAGRNIALCPGTKVLDDQGSYGTSWWSMERTDEEELRAMGLPPLPKGYWFYAFQASFNAITKEIGIQRHVDPRGTFARRYGPPWNQQVFIPYIPRPGVLLIRRFDAEEADFTPSRVSMPERRGERETPEGWTIELEGLEEHMVEQCTFHHDEDFTILYMGDFRRFYVWSFVEDDEVAGTASG